jgi:hypothetical protein
VSGDCRGEMIAELTPGGIGSLEHDDAEAKSSALPDLLEDQLTVRARQGCRHTERGIDIGESGSSAHWFTICVSALNARRIR